MGDRVGGLVVGDGLEDQLALDLEHVAYLVEDARQLGVRREGRQVPWDGHRPMVAGHGRNAASCTSVAYWTKSAFMASTTRSRPVRLAV